MIRRILEKYKDRAKDNLNKSLFFTMLIALNGWRLYRKIQKRSGRNNTIFVSTGATGDLFLQAKYLNSYIREKQVKRFRIVSEGNLELFRLFDFNNVFPISHLAVVSLYQYKKLTNKEDLILLFTWHRAFTHFNRCRVRMTERFQFIDSYTKFTLNLQDPKGDKPNQIKIDCNKEYWLNSIGFVKNKTVIISPQANSITQLGNEFWNNVIDLLKAHDFRVFVNSFVPFEFTAPSLMLNYHDIIAAVNYGGYFIGVRSGLCDILSDTTAKKVIIYPETNYPLDYSEHRSDLQFSSFQATGFRSENVYEFESPLLCNITDTPNYMSMDDYQRNYLSLIDNIINAIISENEEEITDVGAGNQSTRNHLGRREADALLEKCVQEDRSSILC